MLTTWDLTVPEGWPTVEEIRHEMAKDSAWSPDNWPCCIVSVRGW